MRCFCPCTEEEDSTDNSEPSGIGIEEDEMPSELSGTINQKEQK